MQGKLILFPVAIGGEQLEQVLPPKNRELLDDCTTFIVEELRSARRFLKQAGYSHAIDDTEFLVLNEHTSERDIVGYLDATARGGNVGLLSEAGLPCVADPGMMITRMAQERGIEVVPLVGPSSLMLALMGSGLNGQRFAFKGYLPVERGQRCKALRDIEARALRENETQIFIEAPYRNNQMLESLLACCKETTRVCVACDLTMPTQYLRTMTVQEWKCTELPQLHKRNTVFLLGR
ncbi:MAG: SAM-dependent methyltransferase [Bacteroidales bacterium]|nr:SAM-dependent methyltransferase [Bacteroidales bacterium]